MKRFILPLALLLCGFTSEPLTLNNTGSVSDTLLRYNGATSITLEAPGSSLSEPLNIPAGDGCNLTNKSRTVQTTVFCAQRKPLLEDDIGAIRQNLANEIFNFLYAHALCMEGQDQPCDWVYDGAYELHWAAKELQSSKPLREIHIPVSDWERGGYENYLNPLTYLQHESIKLRLGLLIRYGINSIPPRRR